MRASRVALLAAAQLGWAVLASGPARAVDARAAWSDLWHTPDQQGQALLEDGQPAQAAGRFRDPRRRAYADIQAGRYQDAAQLLASFDDARSEYNRGNALARIGRLQAALASYDAALKQTPADEDARHNRDLVERALRQQRQSSGSQSRNGRQGGQGAGSSGRQQQQAGAGQQSGSGSRQSSGAQSAGGRTASNGSRDGTGRAGNSGQQPGGGGIPPGSGGPQAAGASGSGDSKEAPGQAQRDAAEASAYARERQQHGAAGNTGQAPGSQRDGARNGADKGPDSGLLQGGTQTPKQPPESERQLALDQWLRQIPDSPAGLLQRKFLIEHMRQQDGDEPQGSGP